MIASPRAWARTVAALAGLALCSLTLHAAPASASPRPPSGRPGAPAAVAAAAPSASGWTAGGLVSGVSAPRTAALAPSGFAEVGGCVFYASSSSAGGYCPSGSVGSGGVPQSLRAWLNGAPFKECRFFELPDGMVVNADEPPGGHFMLKTCLKGYDFAQPWGGQHVSVVVFVQWVPKDRRDDWLHVSGKMGQLWNVLSNRNYYPLPRIGSGPSSPVRVGAYQYFWATWVRALDSTKETQPSFRRAYQTISRGTVFLHATISDLTIDPGGEGMKDIPCGRADVPFDPDARDTVPRSEGGDQPSTCWAVYEHSSASAENATVHLRGKATWHVQVETADGTPLAELGDFHYTVSQRLAVGEVQPLTDW